MDQPLIYNLNTLDDQQKIIKFTLLTLNHWRKGVQFTIIEPVHEISNNVVCATSKASDQSAHTRSLIRAFASRLSIL